MIILRAPITRSLAGFALGSLCLASGRVSVANDAQGRVSGPEAFMAVANATAAVVQKAPPFITYRLHGVVQVVGGDGVVDRTVTVRTEDGRAIVRDDKTGRDDLKPPFPAPPNFDALSTFAYHSEISFYAGSRRGPRPDIDMHIVNVEPLHYATVASRADAVAYAVRGYAITYADDAMPRQGHLHLEPSSQQRREDAWLSDVWYDPQTMLPTRIVYDGQNEFALDARYATTSGFWLLSSIRISSLYSERNLGRFTLAFRGEYADYRFSTSPPDSRLGALR
jgi:hypothetical protein